jgi:hypothetical protein
MTPAAKVTYLAALLVGLSVGLVAGYRQRIGFLESFDETRTITAPSTLGDFSKDAYAHADFDHARAALLAYAGLLEEIEKAKPDRTQKYELSNTYVRLALLEDEEGDSEQSLQFMTKARYWHAANGDGRDLSDSEVKAAVTRFDDQFGISRPKVNAR